MRTTDSKYNAFRAGYVDEYLPPFMSFKEKTGSSKNGYKYHKKTAKKRRAKG